jgi:xylulokinase
VQKSGGENAYASLARLVDESAPGSNGLVALPYFYGERTPINDPQARGMIFGLTLNHTRADIYRALLESVGFAIRHNLEVMKAEGIQPARFLAVGGGTQNRAWMKMVCDIVGIPQAIPSQRLGACYGDAFLAGVGVGLFSSTQEISRWLEPAELILPDMGLHSFYDEYYAIYKELYSQNAGSMNKLSLLGKV